MAWFDKSFESRLKINKFNMFRHPRRKKRKSWDQMMMSRRQQVITVKECIMGHGIF